MEPITKGWSEDRKYCVTDHNQVKYLLRISNENTFSRKQEELRLLGELQKLQIPMSLAMECDRCQEGIYILHSWIQGKDAEEYIPVQSDTRQYEYGILAGQYLKKIHSIPCPSERESWDVLFNRKLDRKIKVYEECFLHYEKGQIFLDFLEDNRYLLAHRPQCFHHGDYHIGNMMVDEHGALHIIDFERYDYGDPWEEFNRIVWCVQKAPVFATGMVDGYFENQVPPEFWRLLALYIVSNSLSSLPWAIPFGEKQIRVMRDQADEILEWYDQMRICIPRWYQR